MVPNWFVNVSSPIVGISKKTLDDYLSQIRLGKKYGFDFHQHKKDKIGVLRSFVRKYKNIYVDKTYSIDYRNNLAN